MSGNQNPEQIARDAMTSSNFTYDMPPQSGRSVVREGDIEDAFISTPQR